MFRVKIIIFNESFELKHNYIGVKMIFEDNG